MSPSALCFVLVTAAVALVDQLTKHVARRRLAPGQRGPSWGPLTLMRVENPGTTFGWLGGNRRLLEGVSALSVAAIVAVVVVYDPLRMLSCVAFGLLAGGTLGNLVDRLRRGTVTDFLQLGRVVFNVADLALNAALVALIAVALTR